MIKNFTNQYKNNEKIKHVFWITVVYILSQGLLIFVSGIWWDDWGYVNKNWDYLLEVFLQSSLPLQAYIDASLWLLPDGAYRILVFLYFYAGSLLVYAIIKKIDVFSSHTAFWITLLYITIPINDVRITWICYGYSLGLFAFWIAFYLVTLWQGKKEKKAVIMRVFSLLVLVFSFNTESIMLMTLLILLYLYYERLKEGWNWSEIRNNIKKCFKAVVCYVDFLLAPIIFYFGKHMLFPGYGIYGGHNYVDWRALPGLLIRSPVYALTVIKEIILNYINVLSKFTVIIVLIIVILCCFWSAYRKNCRKSTKLDEDENYGRLFVRILIGAFCFFSGFFAYVIRCQGAFVTTGTGGRNSLLLGIGTAILFYYLVHIICRKEIRNIILVSLITIGICHFNLTYLDWQEDYYQQLRFREEVRDNRDILNNDTFLCLYNYPAITTAFYQFNGNSRAVTGEETRFYLGNVSDLLILRDMNKDSWFLNAYNMQDWNYSHENCHLDGLLLINNMPIDNIMLIKLRLKEIFNKDEFNEWMSDTKDIDFVPVTKEESEALIKAQEDGILTRENIFEYVAAYPLD